MGPDQRLRNGIDAGQSGRHHGGDDQKGQGQPQNIRNQRTFFHFFAASFFLGAPNFAGRPIRSSRTTQQFMTRMA